MPIVVSNSSPLIHLAKIGKFNLLQEFFAEICVPEAVYKECITEGRDREEVHLIRNAEWIHVAKLKDRNLVKLLRHDIDHGEAEAIALALELDVDLVLLDDADGREKARIYRLPVTGTIGILLRAKMAGRLASLKTSLEDLKKTGFWLNPKLVRKLLQEAGEQG